MTQQPLAVDPTRCPLCGQPNACDMACGEPSGACWCVNATFTAALLARVPDTHRRLACVCRTCAEAATCATSDGASA